jgi:hypothetical protein
MDTALRSGAGIRLVLSPLQTMRWGEALNIAADSGTREKVSRTQLPDLNVQVGATTAVPLMPTRA